MEPVDLWPQIPDYLAALRDPANSIASDRLSELAGAEFRHNARGPVFARGSSAVAFFARTEGGTHVVRCYLRPPGHAKARYEALAQRCADRPVPAFAAARWVDDAIRTRDRWWPLILMEQVEGRALRTYVEENLAERTGLLTLAERWLELVTELTAVEVAHGDLQGANVRVGADGRPRLIDLDAVWLPSLAELPPDEYGHPDFRHPLWGAGPKAWGRFVDTFPTLVIYTSLRAVANDPTLWDRFHNEQNLIFSRSDLLQPGRTDLWRQLTYNGDEEVRAHLVPLLARCCARPEPLESAIEDLLAETAPSSEPTAPRRAGPPADGRGWWDDSVRPSDPAVTGWGAASGPPALLPTVERPTVEGPTAQRPAPAPPPPVVRGPRTGPPVGSPGRPGTSPRPAPPSRGVLLAGFLVVAGGLLLGFALIMFILVLAH